MKKIFSSASKLVFILMAIAVIILTTLGKVEAKDFISLASYAFIFYFTKSTPNTPSNKVE